MSIYYVILFLTLIILLKEFIELLKIYYIKKRDYKINKTGKKGEDILYKNISKINGEIFRNIFVPKDDGKNTEIDMILINKFGIYVFESKNINGIIIGDENQREWTRIKKEIYESKFFNPLWQNMAHIRSLDRFLKLGRNINYFSYIVFNDEAILDVNFNEKNHKICKYSSVADSIIENQKNLKYILTKSNIKNIANKIQSIENINKNKALKNHIKNMQNNKILYQNKDKIQFKNFGKCPECGSPLLKRKGSKDEFLGCSSYPLCKYRTYGVLDKENKG